MTIYIVLCYVTCSLNLLCSTEYTPYIVVLKMLKFIVLSTVTICRVTVVKVALLALQDLLVILGLQVATVHLEKLVKEDFR